MERSKKRYLSNLTHHLHTLSVVGLEDGLERVPFLWRDALAYDGDVASPEHLR
jgi:hypothetical protein